MRSNKIMKRQLGEYDVLQRMTGTYFSWNTLYKKWKQPHPKFKCRAKDLLELWKSKGVIECLVSYLLNNAKPRKWGMVKHSNGTY